MQFERHVFSVAACAITLLGLSTSASAMITGTGCVMTGIPAQTAPSSVAAFNSACAGTTTGITPLILLCYKRLVEFNLEPQAVS